MTSFRREKSDFCIAGSPRTNASSAWWYCSTINLKSDSDTAASSLATGQAHSASSVYGHGDIGDRACPAAFPPHDCKNWGAGPRPTQSTNNSGEGSVRPVRWGILGTGFIADLQASDLAEHGFTIQAVGSRSAASATEFAAKFPIASAHGSYEDLVADPDVDVVYLSTPHPFHHENALLALNAGKHVLIEKPFAMNAWQARESVDLAEAKGLVALEAMWNRYLPHMVRIRELVRTGALGDVRTMIVDVHLRVVFATEPEHQDVGSTAVPQVLHVRAILVDSCS